MDPRKDVLSNTDNLGRKKIPDGSRMTSASGGLRIMPNIGTSANLSGGSEPGDLIMPLSPPSTAPGTMILAVLGVFALVVLALA